MANEKQVSKALTEILAPLNLKDSDKRHYFLLQQGIINYYNLNISDSLLCELIELRSENIAKTTKKIGEDVIVDSLSLSFDEFIRSHAMYRCFSAIDFNKYQMDSYDCALLRIKEVIRYKERKDD